MPCASSSTRRARPLLGTFVEIAVGEPPSRGLESLIDAAFEEVEKVHGLMSFHEPGSDVSRLNGQAGYGEVVIHDWTIEVLDAIAPFDNVMLVRSHNGDRGLRM